MAPFGALCVLQLFLGSDPIVALLDMVGLMLAACPFCLFGLNPLTLVPILFFLRYTGVATILKTLGGQPLQTYLLHPTSSFALVALLLLIVSTLTVGLELFGPRRGFVPDIMSDKALKQVVIICAVVGLVGEVMNVGSSSRVANLASTGALDQIGAALRPLFLLALIAETIRVADPKRALRLASPGLVALLIIGVGMSLASNARELSADCVIAVGVTLLLRRRLRPIHIIFAAVLGGLFVFYISPVVLAAREYRSSGSTSTYISKAGDIAGEAAISPSYLEDLKQHKDLMTRTRIVTTENDYYGNQSNVANRLSWVALIDTIYDAAHSHEQLGMDGFDQVIGRIEPRFLFPDKVVQRNTYSDWLAYQLGLERQGNMGAYSFGLPMEGYFSLGILGFVIYSAVGIGSILLGASFITNMRSPTLFGIFFFTTFQHEIIEQTSDGFLAILFRNLPLLGMICFALSMYVRRGTRMAARDKVQIVRPFRR